MGTNSAFCSSASAKHDLSSISDASFAYFFCCASAITKARGCGVHNLHVHRVIVDVMIQHKRQQRCFKNSACGYKLDIPSNCKGKKTQTRISRPNSQRSPLLSIYLLPTQSTQTFPKTILLHLSRPNLRLRSTRHLLLHLQPRLIRHLPHQPIHILLRRSHRRRRRYHRPP